MAFTRAGIFLKWSSGATKYCFMVAREGYQGGNKEKLAAYSRSLYDGSLQRVFGATTPRQFMAILMVDDSRPGTTYSDGSENIAVGCVSDLEVAWAATDLQCKSFEDSAYWNAEWVGPWPPQATYDPWRNTADIPINLVQR